MSKLLYVLMMIVCATSLHATEEALDSSSKPTAYARKLVQCNNAYCETIDRANNNAVANIPYEDINGENADRFAFAAGKTGRVVDRVPTHGELNAVAESLWQHAAALLENGAIY